jgi:hypothetical protein
VQVLRQTQLQFPSSTFGAVQVLGQTQLQLASGIFGFEHVFGQTHVQVFPLRTLGAWHSTHVSLQQV